MAIYHLSATPVQRSKGHSAVAGAAYRSGTLLQDRATGQAHDYQRKRGIVESRIIAPENAPGWTHDREELWNRAELAEKRRDAQPAREIRLALPHELTDEERADLVYSYVQDMFVSLGMVADISIHRPDRNGDERNHHAHILLTMRELDGDNFSSKKQRDWNKTELLEYWREEWANYQNHALEEAVFDERVDHRTLEAQGINREPTHHLGKEASTIEREGNRSRIGDENREIAEHNHRMDNLISELAALDAEISEEMEKSFLPSAQEEDRQAEQAALTWEEQKAIAQSAINSPIAKTYEDSIKDKGEIKEFGLGKTLYYSTVVFFENIYYGTMERIRDTWQKYLGRDAYRPAQDRNIELDR